MYSGPEIMYRLSTDHDYSVKIFSDVFRRFTPAKQLIHPEGAIMWITLKTDNKKFILDKVEEHGIKSKREHSTEAKNNFRKLTGKHLSCNYIADIIADYPTFRYGFISTIVDYGVDTGFVHQCGILIDLRNFGIYFYEPYGTYIKYGMDYASPILEFLDCLNLSGYKSNTFHLEFMSPKFYSSYFYSKTVITPDQKKESEEKSRIKVATEGIQDIILKYNNRRKDEFNNHMEAFLADADNFPLVKAKIINKLETPNKIRADDYTVTVVDLLSSVVNSHVPEDQRAQFKDLTERAYTLYGKYNSKSCVSITLVEMNAFLLNNLAKLYSDIKSGDPNEVLLRYLVDLISELKN
jgi:hypothetical protein